MNSVVVALSQIKEVNVLCFIGINYDILDHLQAWKYLDDNEILNRKHCHTTKVYDRPYDATYNMSQDGS